MPDTAGEESARWDFPRGSLAAPRRDATRCNATQRDAMQCTTTLDASPTGGWLCRVHGESEPRDFYAGLLAQPRCTTPSCYIASQVSVTWQDDSFQRSPYDYQHHFTITAVTTTLVSLPHSLILARCISRCERCTQKNMKKPSPSRIINYAVVKALFSVSVGKLSVARRIDNSNILRKCAENCRFL